MKVRSCPGLRTRVSSPSRSWPRDLARLVGRLEGVSASEHQGCPSALFEDVERLRAPSCAEGGLGDALRMGTSTSVAAEPSCGGAPPERSGRDVEPILLLPPAVHGDPALPPGPSGGAVTLPQARGEWRAASRRTALCWHLFGGAPHLKLAEDFRTRRCSSLGLCEARGPAGDYRRTTAGGQVVVLEQETKILTGLGTVVQQAKVSCEPACQSRSKP